MLASTKYKPTEKTKTFVDYKVGTDIKPIALSRLLKFATKWDIFLMIIGLLAALANGIAMPASTLLIGNITNAINETGNSDMVDHARHLSLDFVWIGLGAMIAAYLSFACWMITGERVAIKIRTEYFKALLRQEMGWYDFFNPNELATRVSEECTFIQNGIGEKIATFAFTISTVLAGFLIGFLKGWQLALVLCGCIPFLILAGNIFATAMQKSVRRSSQAYAEAGAMAEQALGSIRTVQNLCGEEHEMKIFKNALEKTKKVVLRYAGWTGFAMGLMVFTSNSIYSIGFYFGSYLVGDHYWNSVVSRDYNVGDVITILLVIMMGAFSTSNISPCIDAFAQARQSAAKAFAVINRKSKISIEDPFGQKLEKIVGQINFENVEFAYPTNKEKTNTQKG